MNTTELPVRPDVSTFVARVRELLADLPEEDRLELTEGLEADLTDLVTERGGGALGDPEAYARELRTAAGLAVVPARRRLALAGFSPKQQVDGVRALWDDLVDRPRLAPAWSVVAALRPAWWALRAWVAAVLLARVVPGWYDYGLVWLPGVPQVVAAATLAVCVVGSVLVGLGRVWPGSRTPGGRGLVARLVLVALNAGAVAGLFVVNGLLEDSRWDSYSQGHMEARQQSRHAGLLNQGREVCNIAAYDATGDPVIGVQLFDQAGRPLNVRCFDREARMVPWMLGDVARWNVFPLGKRERPVWREERRADLTDAAFPTPDRATTPAVTNPLLPPVAPEKAEEAEAAEERERGDRKRDGTSREGSGDDQRR